MARGTRRPTRAPYQLDQITNPSKISVAGSTRGTKFAAMRQVVALNLLVVLAVALRPVACASSHLSNNHQYESSSSHLPDEVKLANDKRAQEAAEETGVSGKREIESLLVRQLSDLIMNNEPAAIRQKLDSERIEGQLTAETNRLVGQTARLRVPPFKLKSGTSPYPAVHAKSHDENELSANNEPLEDGDDDEEDSVRQSMMSSPSSTKKRRHMADDDGLQSPPQPQQDSAVYGNNSGGDPAGTQAVEQFLQEQQMLQQFAAEQQQQQQQQQTVTCSPDYEDQTIMVDQAQMSELLASGGLGAGGGGATINLTADQRQQLLNGPGMSGWLVSNNLTGGGGNPTHFHQQVSIGQCVPAGSRMIEVITKVITPILFTIIIIVGLLGNIIVMLVILEDRQVERELTPTNLLILDLSLADLSFIVLCIPFTGWDYAVGHWVFGSLWCKFNQYLIVVCALSSIYTLVLMSCDRFMAIVYPIECISYRTSRNMLHAIVIKWIVILLVASPTIFMHGLVDSPLAPDQYNCRFLSDQFNPLHFQFIFFITSYFLPLVLIFFLYLSLLRRLWCGQKPHGHKESHKMLESKKKVTWLVASIVIVFAACWFPIQIMLILMRLKTHKITATYVAVQVFAHTLGYMNSCVNPIVYAFASDTFNQSFKKSRLGRACLTYLCCQRRRSNGGNSLNNNNNNHLHRHSLSTTNGHTTHHNAQTATIGLANHHSASSYHNRMASTTTLIGGGGAAGRGRQGATSRNSLQIVASNQPGQQPLSAVTGGRSNKSMGNIFSPPASRNLDESAQVEEGNHLLGDAEVHCAPQQPTIALEPRDRAPIVMPPPPPQQQRLAASSSANQIDRAVPTAPKVVVVAKQQLVARMVPQAQGGPSAPVVVAHDCQPPSSAVECSPSVDEQRR